MRWLPGLLVCAMVLAGCSDDGNSGAANDDEPIPGPGDSAGAGEPTLDAPPTWQLGQWWQYTTDFGDGQTTATRVVTEDLGDSWLIEPAEETTAFWEAVFDITVIGPQRKADLAGDQGGPIEFWQWPLVEGKAWSMTWDGQTWEALASVDGAVATVDYAAGNETRRMVYDAEVGWFTEMAAFDASGQEAWSARLLDYGQRYDGQVTRVEVLRDLALEGGSSHGQILVPADARLWSRLDVECADTEVFYFALTPQDNPGAREEWLGGPGGCGIAETILRTEPVAGTWFYDYVAMQVAFADVHLVVYTVEIVDF